MGSEDGDPPEITAPSGDAEMTLEDAAGSVQNPSQNQLNTDDLAGSSQLVGEGRLSITDVGNAAFIIERIPETKDGLTIPKQIVSPFVDLSALYKGGDE